MLDLDRCQRDWTRQRADRQAAAHVKMLLLQQHPPVDPCCLANTVAAWSHAPARLQQDSSFELGAVCMYHFSVMQPAAAGPLPDHITLAHVLWDNTTKVSCMTADASKVPFCS
jgi:hypothetical protein